MKEISSCLQKFFLFTYTALYYLPGIFFKEILFGPDVEEIYKCKPEILIPIQICKLLY